MAFSEPNSLFQIFEELEEENLFLIQNVQELESGIEDLKTSKKEKYKILNKKHYDSKSTRDGLKNMINTKLKSDNLGLHLIQDVVGDNFDRDMSSLLKLIREV